MSQGISRKDVNGVLSIAQHLQSMRGLKGLELAISKGLPSESLQETEISHEVMYELARDTLRLDPQYVEQALKLHSGSIGQKIEALKCMGAYPSLGLANSWVLEIAQNHWSRTKQILDSLE